MKMNDIREEYGADFISKLTEEFLGGLSANSEIFTEKELRDEIVSVRGENHEPLVLEMLFALCKVMLSKYRAGLLAHHEAMELSEIQISLFEKHVDILEGMVNYLEKKPKKIASNAAMAKHAPIQKDKNSVKEYWRRWKDDPKLYANQDEFARDMLEKFGKDAGGALTSTSTIVKKWIPEFKRSVSSE